MSRDAQFDWQFDPQFNALHDFSTARFAGTPVAGQGNGFGAFGTLTNPGGCTHHDYRTKS